jgi:predicted glycoside hydrolase/deacetylase ChbG (UPF0249 family)
MQNSQTNKLLGYSADARLLIINADDFGMCHAINEAILQSIKEGVVQSTSLMTPCPWALHAIRLLQENPDIAFGVHLTLISEAVNYGWKPLTSREKVPSLIDETDYFYNLERMPEFLAKAKLDEVEVEFRAQIETVLAAGLKPTHLDWHCLRNGGRADIFDLSFALAKEYGLALRVYDSPFIEELHNAGLPADDHTLLDSYDVDPDTKSGDMVQLLRELPAGLSEWAVHPGFGNGELQTIEPESWRVRQMDFDFVMSEEARATIREEGITLLSYKLLQQVWQASPS